MKLITRQARQATYAKTNHPKKGMIRLRFKTKKPTYKVPSLNEKLRCLESKQPRELRKLGYLKLTLWITPK
ncbi:hypothetical protein CFPU101_08490 [Chroococcus sp. FPU101]|nr:hypothetical protein CFPU101_08490 [Chroococcus sp. FPU101]